MNVKAKVLVVDDEPAVLALVRMGLKANGYEVLTAASGIEGLIKAREETPDLIILDISMPGRDGGDVAQAVRSDRRLARVPILFLTSAITAEEARARAARGGEEKFLAKPVVMQELLEYIRCSLCS